MLHDRYYHAARASEERLLAITSPNVRARAIHLKWRSDITPLLKPTLTLRCTPFQESRP